MNKIKKQLTILSLFLIIPQLWAHDGKTTKVMEELITFHEFLVKEIPGKIDTKNLIRLLGDGADRKRGSEIFERAIPFAKKLGDADSLEDKRNAYALLVEELSSLIGHHDKSNAVLFYCPMENKKWVSRGERIVNPYLKNMRNCGGIQK